jgi:hypothetical protein
MYIYLMQTLYQVIITLCSHFIIWLTHFFKCAHCSLFGAQIILSD